MANVTQNTIRFPDDMYKQIRARAEANFRPIHGEVLALLGAALAGKSLDTLDAQERAGLTAIWFVSDDGDQDPYIALEMLGGLKRYVRIWLRHMGDSDKGLDWGWVINKSAFCVWRSHEDEPGTGGKSTSS